MEDITKKEENLTEGYSYRGDYNIISLFYKNKDIAGYVADVEFVFHHNQLYSGEYNLHLPKIDRDSYYIDIYKDLQNKLIKLYGEENITSKDTLDRIDAAEIKIAKEFGQSYCTMWGLKPFRSSNLSLWLSYIVTNNGGYWRIQIHYDDPEYFHGWRIDLDNSTEGL